MTVEQKLHQTNARLVELTDAVSSLSEVAAELAKLTDVLSKNKNKDEDKD